MAALLTTNLGATRLLGRGKVRDLYAVPCAGPSADQEALLLVATDRISAFDHVLATGIPGKGRILTQISLFWFDLLASLVPNHLITAEVSEFPASLQPYASQLEGRSMLVKQTKMFPVECVVRGYLTGSGWKEYQASSSVCGIPLPGGLLDGSRLPEPLYTPSTKGEVGTHDENISYAATEAAIGAADAAELKRLTPTQNSSLAGLRRESFWPMRCSRRTPRASGKRLRGSRAARNPPSTNSLYAITWKRSTGTSRPPRRSCPPKWWSAPRQSTLKPSAA